MNIVLILLLAALALVLCTRWAKGFLVPERSPRLMAFLAFAFHAPLGFLNGVGGRGQTYALANLNEGEHEAGLITRRADAAISTRFLLVKVGTDANHVAIAGTADIPLGIAQDEAAAAEDRIAVQLLGSAGSTKRVVASAAIAVDAMLVAAANGKVRTLPVAAGTYYIVGRALEAAGADGDVIEMDPCFPIQRVVT